MFASVCYYIDRGTNERDQDSNQGPRDEYGTVTLVIYDKDERI